MALVVRRENFKENFAEENFLFFAIMGDIGRVRVKTKNFVVTLD